MLGNRCVNLYFGNPMFLVSSPFRSRKYIADSDSNFMSSSMRLFWTFRDHAMIICRGKVLDQKSPTVLKFQGFPEFLLIPTSLAVHVPFDLPITIIWRCPKIGVSSVSIPFRWGFFQTFINHPALGDPRLWKPPSGGFQKWGYPKMDGL